MVFAAKCLDVVLHHQAAANDFDVDGHSLAVWRSRKSYGDVCWGKALILALRETEAPRWNVDLRLMPLLPSGAISILSVAG